jgi:hypothetical protein
MVRRESSEFPSMRKGQSEFGTPGRAPIEQRSLAKLPLALALGICLIGDVLSAGARTQGDQHSGQWCAYFTGGRTDCTFASFAECLDTISGQTALCDQNPQYGRPASPQAASVPIKRMRHRATQGLGVGSPAEQKSSAGVPAAAGPSWFEDFRELLSRNHIN